MRKVQTDRSLLMYIVLSIVTCGIYGFYFIYKLAEDMNEMCEGDGETTGGLLTYIVLSFLTCGIYQLYWLYKIANRLKNNAGVYGVNINEDGTTILLWYLVGSLLCGIGPLVAIYFIINNTNKLAFAYNQRKF